MLLRFFVTGKESGLDGQTTEILRFAQNDDHFLDDNLFE
jgi:hypothetical protein